MCINTRHSNYKLSVKRATIIRRRRRQQKRRTTPSSSSSSSIRGSCRRSLKPMAMQMKNKCNKSNKLSEKLRELKNLIPSHDDEGMVMKPDQLFQEAADYIVLLRTRVVVLQKLIEYYGNNASENENVVLL